MFLIVVSLIILFISGSCALFLDKRPAAAAVAAVSGCIVSCLLAAFPVFSVFLSGKEISLRAAWQAPGGGEIFLLLDSLSAFFLVPLLILSALSALYGWGYLRKGKSSESAGRQWFFFNILIAGMMAVLLTADSLMFLVCWEIMALSSFFLVVSRDEDKTARQAGFIYLGAAHLGTAALLLMFALLSVPGVTSGFWNSAAFSASGVKISRALLLTLGILGFGMKAGFMPLHIWLPKAHPAAPSHVSALMSGIMIKTGIYGILRLFSVLGGVDAWCGGALILTGICSGVIGMLLALGQRDSKRVLAYSSIENIGIICMGIGLAVYAKACGSILVCLLALSGALLHLFNHAFFKGLLFMAAGAAAKSCGTRDPDELGGCAKALPVTSASFFLGSAAASGIPLLNGFAGKFLIYLAAFCGLPLKGSGLLFPCVGVIAGLSLSGCLSLACFSGFSGVMFLGKPRGRQDVLREYSILMCAAMTVLSAVCLFLTFAGPLFSFALAGAAAIVFQSADFLSFPGLADRLVPLSLAAAGAYILIALAVVFRRVLLRNRKVSAGETWNCGYAGQAGRAQYTAASFFYPLRKTFTFFNVRKNAEPVLKTAVFPSGYSGEPRPGPGIFKIFLTGIALRLEESLSRLRWLQQGKLHIYIMYIMAALLILLLWKIR
ncbi:MAG: proton-conducting transporter membrane subunit [Candidatus Omnitrophota bacterium]|jgi:formate hydrogenlyase subunit 3/multisubunit Na+/H+ antiporter MnhD subunit